MHPWWERSRWPILNSGGGLAACISRMSRMILISCPNPVWVGWGCGLRRGLCNGCVAEGRRRQL